MSGQDRTGQDRIGPTGPVHNLQQVNGTIPHQPTNQQDNSTTTNKPTGPIHNRHQATGQTTDAIWCVSGPLVLVTYCTLRPIHLKLLESAVGVLKMFEHFLNIIDTAHAAPGSSKGARSAQPAVEPHAQQQQSSAKPCSHQPTAGHTNSRNKPRPMRNSQRQSVHFHRHKRQDKTEPVSYTHLTLPTKRIV